MAIDVCSELPSTGISPRISFSHDLKNADDGDPVEDHHQRSDLCLLDSSSDFVFCITNGGFSQKLSSADELFCNGKIVPMEISKFSNAPNRTHQSVESSRRDSQPSSTGCKEKKRLKEFLSADEDDEEEEEEEKPSSSSKSFWQFKRSSSLNCDTTTPGKSLIRSLQFLSRSNSTGSALNPKQTEIPKETQKQRLQKQCSVSSRRSSSSSSSSSSSTYYFYNSSQKPSLKKNGGSSGNGVRISPVLNLPQAYIPKATVSFFGFGSLFCNGKTKKKK